MLTIYGVSIILCFIKILYGSRNFFLKLNLFIHMDNAISPKLFSLEVR